MNIDKVMEEFDRQLVEMHPMYGRDSHNPPPLYNLDNVLVDEVRDFIRSALLQQKQEFIERLRGIDVEVTVANLVIDEKSYDLNPLLRERDNLWRSQRDDLIKELE